MELQELCFANRSALTHRGESAHPKERFPSVCGGQEQGKEGAGQVVGQMGVSRRLGHRSGDRLRTEIALNFIRLPLKSLLFQTVRGKSSSRYSANRLCCPDVLGSLSYEPRIFTWELWQPQDVTSQQGPSHWAAGQKC